MADGDGRWDLDAGLGSHHGSEEDDGGKSAELHRDERAKLVLLVGVKE